jgi:hypothetical protein
MNSLPILIIGAPAVLAVIAAKKSQKQTQKPEFKLPDNWAWPKKWRPPVAKTGQR